MFLGVILRSGIEFFTDEQRLGILKATQAGQSAQIQALLDFNPKLIHAKTKTKSHSLLHVAAQQGHVDVCRLLLSHGHPTNPVDIDGNTPYQKAKLKEIQTILVEAHSTYILSESVFNSQTSNVRVSILNKSEFCAFISSIQKDMCMEDTFAVTLSRNFNLQTCFREDALMIPYYGELLVAHEEEHVQNFSLARQEMREIDTNEFEMQAYAKGIMTLLKRYPEIVGFPSSLDLIHVCHVKKLIIAYGLLGFASYAQELFSKNPIKFQALLSSHDNNIREVYGMALHALNGSNLVLVKQFRKELTEIYQTSVDTDLVVVQTPSHS